MTATDLKAEVGFASLRRFLPYLWPKGEIGLKARIVVSLLFVLASKWVQVKVTPFALQDAIDGMAKHDHAVRTVILMLVIGYAAGVLRIEVADQVWLKQMISLRGVLEREMARISGLAVKEIQFVLQKG